MEQYQGPSGGGLRFVDLPLLADDDGGGDGDQRHRVEDYWRMKAHSLSNCWRRHY